MKKVVRLSESQLKRIINNIVNEQKINPQQTTQNTVGGINVGGQTIGGIPTETKPNLGCVAPTDYKIKGSVANSFKYTRPDGEYIFYSNGDVWLYELNSNKRLQTGKWTCGNSNIEVRWDSDPKAVNYQPLPKNAFSQGTLGAKNCAQELTDIFGGKFVFFGCRGNAVKAVQDLLKINADGIFGKGTRDAVMKFQLSKKIKSDGVVGRDTLSFLQKG
jgi:peptidoglycan hydrolase-like protein with peptidoglycan-binding domain